MLVALAFDFVGVCWLLVTSTKTGISSATTSRWPTVGGDVGLTYTPGFPRESALMKEQSNYSIQLRFGQFGPRFILPAFLESGPSLSSRLPRESALMKEQRFTRSSYRFGPRFIVPASSRVSSTWVVPASDGCPMERKKGGTRAARRKPGSGSRFEHTRLMLDRC